MSVDYSPQDYWDGLLERQLDESGVAYPGLAPSFNRAMYAALRASTARLLDDHGLRHEPGRVLDIGSGTGIWIDFWRAAEAAHLEGADLTEVSVRHLAEKYPDVPFRRTDIGAELSADAGAGTFDVVSVMSVLLHIVDDARWRTAFANVQRLLRPGGHAVLIEPVVAHGWHGPPFGPESNSRARPLPAYRGAIADAGLELVEVRPATVLLSNPIDARRPGTFALMERAWGLLGLAVGRSELRGRIVGAALGTLDAPLRRAMPYGPTAKLLLLRKPG
jgi:SAM-dependent methyltransferase